MGATRQFNQIAAIRGSIRRVFQRSPLVIKVKMAARREVPKHNNDGSRSKRDSVQYLCSECGSWEKGTKVAVDHRIPVIDPEIGFVDWNTLVARMFCEEENLQVLCDSCHKKKTDAETATRLSFRYTRELQDLERKWVSGAIPETQFVAEVAKYQKKTKPGYERVVEEADRLYLSYIRPILLEQSAANLSALVSQWLSGSIGEAKFRSGLRSIVSYWNKIGLGATRSFDDEFLHYLVEKDLALVSEVKRARLHGGEDEATKKALKSIIRKIGKPGYERVAQAISQLNDNH